MDIAAVVGNLLHQFIVTAAGNNRFIFNKVDPITINDRRQSVSNRNLAAILGPP